MEAYSDLCRVLSLAGEAETEVVVQIFLSYRREDEAAFAGRLYDHLVQKFTADKVFLDVDRLAPGVNFVTAVQRQVSESDVVLVLIGPRWLNSRGLDGARRLDDETDLVRLEIQTALRLGKVVIPVLASGAVMPRADDLPEALRELSVRNAVRLSHERFKGDYMVDKPTGTAYLLH